MTQFVAPAPSAWAPCSSLGLALATTTTAVRAFNRFHTRLVGALNEHLLGSGYTLPQARVIFEVGHAPPGAAPSARELGELLRVDTGYLSRLVSGLESDGLIERAPSPHNAKRLRLALTAQGRKVFARLNKASAREIGGLLAPLSESERRELVVAMGRVRRLLGDAPPERSFTLRDPIPGDMGWIVHRQARLYAEEYGWDWTFEGLVAEIAGQFVQRFQPEGERCWVAEREGDGHEGGPPEMELKARLRPLVPRIRLKRHLTRNMLHHPAGWYLHPKQLMCSPFILICYLKL